MRRRRLIALVMLALLVAASVSYTGPYILDIVDNEGRATRRRPAAGAADAPAL